MAPVEPVVVAVELCVIVVPDTLIAVNGVVEPTAPVNVTEPPVPPVRVSDFPPSIVLENEIAAPAGVAPPFVVSAMKFAASVTGPVIPMVPPLVVWLPFKLIAVPL